MELPSLPCMGRSDVLAHFCSILLAPRGQVTVTQALRPLMGPLCAPDLVKALQRALAVELNSEPFRL
jgi:hypothetical protein